MTGHQKIELLDILTSNREDWEKIGGYYRHNPTKVCIDLHEVNIFIMGYSYRQNIDFSNKQIKKLIKWIGL